MRRTRIVSTIGPSSDSPEILESLLRAGVDVCRLNYSHGEPAEKTPIYERIRGFESIIGRPTCILADLPGPKLRLGVFPGVILLVKGQTVELHCGVAKMSNASAAKLPVEYAGLSSELNVNDPVLIADGLIRLVVTQTKGKSAGIVTCVVDDGGPVSKRKGINVPGTMVDLPAIGKNDKLALEHALQPVYYTNLTLPTITTG